MYDASNRKDVRKAEKAMKAISASRQEVLRSLMSTKPGRDYVASQLAQSNTFHTPFNADPIVMAFQCGEQNSGFRLMAEVLEVCPEYFIQMMRETNERSNTSGSDGNSGSGNSGDDASSFTDDPADD